MLDTRKKIRYDNHKFLLSVLALIGLISVYLFIGVNLAKADTDKSTNDKDNVLIYANKNGEARGYDLLWKQSNITGTYYQESAIVHKDGVIYLTSAAVEDLHPGNRDIFALDASDGSIINRYTIGSGYGSPVIDGNNLYIGTCDESWDPDTTWTGEYGLYSFDISNIRSSGFMLNWFHADSAKIAEPAVYDDSKVYYSQFEGSKIIALNKSDGSQAWEFSTGGWGACMMLLHDNAIYKINSYYGARSLFKIDATTGLQIWAKPVSNYAWDNSITFDGDNNALYFAMYYAGSNSAASYDLDGNLRWQKSLNCSSLSFTAYHNNVAFFSDTCGYVYALDSANGDNVWGPIRLGNGVTDETDISSVTISGGQIFIGTTNSSKPNDSRGLGKFFILDELSGEIIWQYHEADLGNVIAPASIFNGIFYNVTSCWDVFAFDVGDGESEWLNPRYDKNNTGYSPGGLTQSKYVKSICSNSDTNTICNIDNLYSGRTVETKLKMEGENIESVMLNNGDYHINVDGSVVYLPTISAGGELKEISIKSGTDPYDASIPRLKDVLPTTTNILSSTFNPASKSIKLSFDNTSSISATINSFKQPFLNVINTISDENQTLISASGLSGYTDVSSVPMELTPSTGSVDVSISAWQIDGVQRRAWSESNYASNAFINHTVFNLDPNETYVLKMDETSSQIKSDSNGTISFTGGPAAREFELLKYISDGSSGTPEEPADTGDTAEDETAGETATTETLGQESASIAKPTSLTAKFSDEKNAVELSWKASSTADIDGYKIFRSESYSKGYVKIGDTKKDILTYLDEDYTAGKTYYYQVRAYKDSEQSASSNIASATVPSDVAPAKPKVSVVDTTTNSLTARWKKSEATNLAGYTINLYKGSEKVRTKDLSAKTNEYSFLDLDAGTLYKVELIAKDNEDKTSSPAYALGITKMPEWWVQIASTFNLAASLVIIILIGFLVASTIKTMRKKRA